MELKDSLWISLAETATTISGIDYVIIAIIILIIAAIVFSMIRHRKRGGGCYGCPHSQTCGMRQDSCPSNTQGDSSNAK